MNFQKKPEEGDVLSDERQITSDLIKAFGDISDDKNPIHFDNEFAGKTLFKKRIAHGLLSVGYISALLTNLLGEGNVILSLGFDIKAPVYVDDMILLNLEVIRINRNKTIDLEFQISNKLSNLLLIKGTIRCLKVY
jgi:3-hydroxybutyryl-CoA dehydratase